MAEVRTPQRDNRLQGDGVLRSATRLALSEPLAPPLLTNTQSRERRTRMLTPRAS
jgi:hypothetical protein